MTGETRQTVDATHTASRVLELLHELDGAGVTELADRLDRAKSTTHGHLATLEDHEFIVRDGDIYRLSMRFLEFAEGVKGRVGEYDIIRTEIENLAAETGEVAQFAREEHGRVVYLYKAKADRGVETASSIGKREDMYSTGLGKAILSQLSPEQREDLLSRQELREKTANTITDTDALHTELERTRERGYAIDDEENILGIRCIAAPAVGDDGTVLGAISVTGPATRMTNQRFDDELAENVRRAANVIEVNTKYS